MMARLERIFLTLTGLGLAVGVLAIVASVAVGGVHLPGREARVDQRVVRQTAPFDRPGVTLEAPGRYRAVILARAWAFQPAEVRVPAGSLVTFVITSQDVIHGFLIEGTNVNAMVIPGQVTTVTARFPRPGTYRFVCHEYCGVGHHAMFGQVVVEG
jgi:cytochrome c oxidase subunit 2